MLRSKGAARDIGKRMRGIPCIYDLNERLRVVDSFENYTQVISLGMPPLEALGTAKEVEEYAKLGNDGMADLVRRHPDHFLGDATKEAERAFSIGANGLQIHTNINGLPLDNDRFFPVFEAAAKYGKAAFFHPSRGVTDLPDYKSEKKSLNEIWWTFGWLYETSAAMARLIFFDMMDKLPEHET